MATAARTAPTSSCRARPTPRRSGTYVNTEGRVQLGNRAAFPPGDAREDWAILRALSDVLGKTLPFDSLGELRRSSTRLTRISRAIDEIAPGDAAGDRGARGASAARPAAEPFASPIARLLSDQPDRARFGASWPMLGASPAARSAEAAE